MNNKRVENVAPDHGERLESLNAEILHIQMMRRSPCPININAMTTRAPGMLHGDTYEYNASRPTPGGFSFVSKI
jgi:hypothetical protein